MTNPSFRISFPHGPLAVLLTPVCGKGIAVIRCGSTPITLRDALYVPSFKGNLVSVGKADANGLYFHGGESYMAICNASGDVSD
jgi:hypothetical protein